MTYASFKIQIMSTIQKVLLCPFLVNPALPSRGNHYSDFFPPQLVLSVLELHIKAILRCALFCGRIFSTGYNVFKIHLCVACVSLFLFNTEYSRAGVCQFVYPFCNWWTHGLLLVQVIINEGAINILIQISL